MRVALILCDESVLRLLLRLRLVNRTNLLSLSLMPEALEPEIVLGLDLALELDRALRLPSMEPGVPTTLARAHLYQFRKKKTEEKCHPQLTTLIYEREEGEIQSFLEGKL